MTKEELERKQVELVDSIYELTKATGLATKEIDAITDGVADCKAYLESSPRVAWVLKEPYDDKDPDTGNPKGGGWSIPHDCFLKETKWSVLSWQRVIYIMYGLKNNCHYADMPYVRDCPEMGNVMKSIAWLNLNKMPAGTTSSYSFAESYQRYWKEVLLKQINLYNPQIIVFGNTFSSCWRDFIPECQKPIDRIPKEGKCFIEVYRTENRILLDAYHPGIRSNVEFYVNSLIDTIKKYMP